jgi:murein DD-endopeptidase MepM/ murein hydrolase activator NlpD
MISTRLRAAALLVPLVCAGAAAQQTPPGLSISLSLQSVHPGDVVRVDLGGASEAERPAGTVFGKSLAFAFDPAGGVWRALIGVDLDTKPDTYRLAVTAGGAPRTADATFRVAPKTFSVRRLKVAAGFVNPPADALEQIARDARILTGIFAAATPTRWTGAFLSPVDGTPTSNFGTRSYFNGVPRSPHAGVDFMSGTGTPIRGAGHGIVALAEPLYFTGNTVIVDHGAGLYSLFAHLSAFRVAKGDPVAPDTIVGLVGATGRVTGPHLHWSVRLNGARVDPLSLVAATQAP